MMVKPLTFIVLEKEFLYLCSLKILSEISILNFVTIKLYFYVMAEWLTVISLIFFGLALLVVEIIFVPGTTLVGVIGFVFLLIGVGMSFKYFGSEAGWVTVGCT